MQSEATKNIYNIYFPSPALQISNPLYQIHQLSINVIIHHATTNPTCAKLISITNAPPSTIDKLAKHKQNANYPLGRKKQNPNAP